MTKINELGKNRLLPFLMAGLLTLALHFLCQHSVAGIEAEVGDHFWRMSAISAERERRVVVIDIDEDSIAQYGPWPWPREQTALLLARLAEQGVAMRIADIAFPDAKPGDQRLSDELANVPTVLAQVLALSADVPLERGRLQGNVATLACPGIFPEANAFIANAPELMGASAGHITPRIEGDGVIRRMPAVICYQRQAYVALSLAALAQGVGAAPNYRLEPGEGWLEPYAHLRHPELPGLSIPIDQRGDILLPWWLSRSAMVSISAKDVLNGALPAGYLRGAWVLIGATAFGIGDTVSTPQAPAASGVEVHAQLLSALLDNRIPYRPLAADGLQLGWLLLVSALILAVSRSPRGAFGVYAPVLAGGLLLLATFGLHAALLWFANLWVAWLTPASFILIVLTLQTIQGYLQSRAESDLLFRNLSSYLPAHVARQIAKQEPGSALNAHHENVIVLYADLRNFSLWCDHLPAEQAGALLHSFYSFAGKIIHQQGGEVEEYIGDAVMGVWRCPGTDLRPLLAAKSLVLTGEHLFGAETGIDSLPPLAVGVGIEQGEVLVGAFGPAQRRAHAVLGRTVTTAINLQAMTGELSQPIIFGEAIAGHWKRKISALSLGNFLLKDRQQPTELFVPASPCDETDWPSPHTASTEDMVSIG